ncbi:hypothetical protein GVAV_001245 [Gurleya vavrai]
MIIILVFLFLKAEEIYPVFHTPKNPHLSQNDALKYSNLILSFFAYDQKFNIILSDNTLSAPFTIKKQRCTYSARIFNQNSFGIYNLCTQIGKLTTDEYQYVITKNKIKRFVTENKIEKFDIKNYMSKDNIKKNINTKFMKVFVVNDYDLKDENENEKVFEIFEIVKQIIEREKWGMFDLKIKLTGIMNIYDKDVLNIYNDTKKIETKNLESDSIEYEKKDYKDNVLKDKTLNKLKKKGSDNTKTKKIDLKNNTAKKNKNIYFDIPKLKNKNLKNKIIIKKNVDSDKINSQYNQKHLKDVTSMPTNNSLDVKIEEQIITQLCDSFKDSLIINDELQQKLESLGDVVKNIDFLKNELYDLLSLKSNNYVSNEITKNTINSENLFNKKYYRDLDNSISNKNSFFEKNKVTTNFKNINTNNKLFNNELLKSKKSKKEEEQFSINKLQKYANLFLKIKSDPNNRNSPFSNANLIILYTLKTNISHIEGLTYRGGACSKNDTFSVIHLYPEDSIFYQAKVTAHEILHSLNASHNCNKNFLMDSEGCTTCRENDVRISECSINEVIDFISKQDDKCFELESLCGNGIIDEGEECDSGLPFGSECCTQYCRLRKNAECEDLNGNCCKDCKLLNKNTICQSENECILESKCDGKSPICKKINKEDSLCKNGFCKNGICQTRELFCKRIGKEFSETCDRANECKLVCKNENEICSLIGAVNDNKTEIINLPDKMKCEINGKKGFCDKGECVSELEYKYLVPLCFLSIVSVFTIFIIVFFN